jgi:hypothetical protein
MLRSYLGAVAVVVLGGCSSTFFFPPENPMALDAGPADYQALVAKDLAKLGNRAAMGPLEISRLRQTRLAQPGDWMVCVRTTIEERPTYIAVFMRDGRVIDRRLAVLVDECAQEQFQPLAAEAKPPS